MDKHTLAARLKGLAKRARNSEDPRVRDAAVRIDAATAALRIDQEDLAAILEALAEQAQTSEDLQVQEASVRIKAVALALQGETTLWRNLLREDWRERGTATITIGSLALNGENKEVFWKGVNIGATRGEFHLFSCLALAKTECCVSYRTLYDAVRGEGFAAGAGEKGFQENVRTIVKRLRKKFMAVDPNFDNIKNVSGVGYKWKQEAKKPAIAA